MYYIFIHTNSHSFFVRQHWLLYLTWSAPFHIPILVLTTLPTCQTSTFTVCINVINRQRRHCTEKNINSKVKEALAENMLKLSRTICSLRLVNQTALKDSAKYLTTKYNHQHNPVTFISASQKCPSFAYVYARNFCTNAPPKPDDPSTSIYAGALSSRIRIVKVFSLTTSLVGISAQPILLEQGTKIAGPAMGYFLCVFAGFFTFVTPFLLHFITKKYVIDIAYNPVTDEYTSTTISLLLLKNKVRFCRRICLNIHTIVDIDYVLC